MKKQSKSVSKTPAIRPMDSREVRAVSGGVNVMLPYAAYAAQLAHRPGFVG